MNEAGKVCPECGHEFQGKRWEGIDAHWKSKHARIMSYEKAWPLISASTYKPRKTPHNECPECGHKFKGNGWDGIDAHWKSKHARIMSYEKAWPLISAGTYKRKK